MNIVVFGILIIQATEMLKVQYVPDDAFYYLQLAKNFSSLGQWTFDSGISVTSGFHLLLAYLLSGLYGLLQPNFAQFVNVGLGLSLLFTIITFIVLWRWAWSLKNTYFFLFLALLLTSRNFVYNSVSGTEWSLVVLLSVGYGLFFFSRKEYRLRHLAALFLIGFLGSLARSDFGLFPFALLVTVWLYELLRHQIMPVAFPLMGLLGSVTGVGFTFLHNFIFTNQFLQSSARMKAYWAEFQTPNYFATPFLAGFLIGGVGLFILFFLVLSAVLLKRKAVRSQKFQLTERAMVMLVASSLSLVGYTIVYAHNGEIQAWYTADLIMPLLLILAVLTDYFKHEIRHPSVVWGCSIVGIVSIVWSFASLYPLKTENARWPHQQIMLQAGQYLQQQPVDGRIGAWNAGIIGYFQGGQVVNLDGLVNNEIYDYAVSNRVPDYLDEQQICYVVDFENMLTEESFRRRGGYDQSQWIADNLEAIIVFDDGRFDWRYLTLYQVHSPNCTP
jgi:hypothetical protein